MRRIFYLAMLFLLLGFTGCSSASYQRIADGFVVNIKESELTPAHKIKLQVVNDKIIRITATADKNFSSEKSLMIIPELSFSDKFEVVDDGSFIVLSTDSIDVKVSKENGGIVFLDKNGNTILAENRGGGKSFLPIEVEGTKGYTIKQIFESPDDEAFYGLGQHQADDFNYKGKTNPCISTTPKYQCLLWYQTKITEFYGITTR